MAASASALDTLVDDVQLVRELLDSIEPFELPRVSRVALLFAVGTHH